MMWSAHFAFLAHWLHQFEAFLPAAIITGGSALLVGCGVGCICSPCKEKDQLFHRQVY
jgi:hypothetical protein